MQQEWIQWSRNECNFIVTYHAAIFSGESVLYWLGSGELGNKEIPANWKECISPKGMSESVWV